VAEKDNLSVLFVCLGNICRSPTAEGVFLKKAEKVGLEVVVDSAGTAGYHVGAAPDNRSQNVAQKRGYDLSKLQCRKVEPTDFENFDHVIAMDNENVANLKQMCPPELHHKIRLFMSYAQSDYQEVPDPYYSGAKGFELVLDLIEQAADGLILQLVK
jgi:protein-tyrosine phosphatase